MKYDSALLENSHSFKNTNSALIYVEHNSSLVYNYAAEITILRGLMTRRIDMEYDLQRVEQIWTSSN